MIAPAKDDKQIGWLPTPEEIRQTCLEIQAGWDEETRRQRSTFHAGMARNRANLRELAADRYTVPEVRLCDLGVAD